MKKLSRNEMKNVMGGDALPTEDTVYCNTCSFVHPEKDCSCGSQGLCDNCGGFKECLAYGHIKA